YRGDGQWTRAASEAAQAADLLPNDRDVQLLAGEMTLTQRRFLDVAERMTPILKINPNDVQALILLGNARARLVTDTDALFRLGKAIRDSNVYEEMRKEMRPDRSLADDGQAEDAFRAALKIAPESTSAQTALVNFLWAVGRAAEAEPLLR